eukprot:gene32245-39000_t
MANYCLKGKELLFNLKRAEWLPIYDDEGIRVVLAEIEEIQQKMESVVERYGKNDVPVSVRVQVAFLYQSQIRNFRYLNSYAVHRLSKIRQLRWELGAILPPHLADALSPHEIHYSSAYSSIFAEINESLGLDLAADLEPPRDVFIEVRVLVDCGKLLTEAGSVSLDAGSVHFVRRSQVESLIREGKLEHVQGSSVF